MLFTLYTQLLSDVIKQHDCDYHTYAADTQLEDDDPPCDVPLALDRLEQCIDSVQRWMLCNKLKLNGDRPEVLCSGSRHSLSRVSETSLRVSGNDIPFKECVKRLGVYLDSTLLMHDHVSSVCKATYFGLRKIASVRP